MKTRALRRCKSGGRGGAPERAGGRWESGGLLSDQTPTSHPRKSSGHVNDKGKNVRQRNAN